MLDGIPVHEALPMGQREATNDAFWAIVNAKHVSPYPWSIDLCRDVHPWSADTSVMLMTTRRYVTEYEDGD